MTQTVGLFAPNRFRDLETKSLEYLNKSNSVQKNLADAKKVINNRSALAENMFSEDTNCYFN